MTATATRITSEMLLAAATDTSQGLRKIAEGKPADHATHTDARSFLGIANLLDLMTAEIGRHQAAVRHRGEALTRIAELRIRGAVELIERGDWQKVAAELREIAGETLATTDEPLPRSALVPRAGTGVVAEPADIRNAPPRA